MAIASDADVLDGRYEVGDVLGRGGMGEVRRARDLRLNRDVAVKFLRADLAAQPEARRRFDEEARNAARLSHPNVVLVFDTGEHAGRPYLVMECLPGHSLHDELQDGPLSQARVTWIARDVLAGLAAAHDAGVVHRDVSPSNILLTDTGRAKLADFGIAKAAESAPHTQVNQVVGTPGYLAPERLRGEPATPASDIFSLGATIKAATARAAVDSQVAHLVDRMTDPDPARRPTAHEALAAFDGVGDVEPETTAIAVVEKDIAPATGPVTAALAATPEVTVATPVVAAPVGWWRERATAVAIVLVAAAIGLLLLLASTTGDDKTPTNGGQTDETVAPAATVTVPAPTTIAEPAPQPEPTISIRIGGGDDDDDEGAKPRGKAKGKGDD